MRKVLVPDWFFRLHISGRIRNKNSPVWSCLWRFKVGALNPKTFESGELCLVNDFLSNPDIFSPANSIAVEPKWRI